MKNTHEVVELGTELHAMPELGLPGAKLVLAVSLGARPRVQAAYLSIPERGEKAVRSESFDDGRVIVDYDDQGRVRGVEFLTLKPPAGVPEFVEAARLASKPDRVILFCAATTIARWWDLLQFGMDLAAPIDRVRKRIAKQPQRWEPLAGSFAAALARPAS